MTTRRQHPFGGRLLVVLDFGPMDARVADVLSFGRDVSRAHRGVTGRRRAGWPGGGRTSLAHSKRIAAEGRCRSRILGIPFARSRYKHVTVV